jgi:uridine kinase
MSFNENTKKLLAAHAQSYPQLQPEDVFKFLYQSSFGCEHLVESCELATCRIRDEFEKSSADIPAKVEPLDGEYSRVYLGYLNQGLSSETLGKLFCLSAKKEEDGATVLKEKLAVAEDMARRGELPFSYLKFSEALAKWQKDGFPPIHHSQAFREAYSPAYRVLSNELVRLLPLFVKLDAMLKNGAVKLAVEGGSASGKSTLGALLEKIYGCTLFHMDDFFLRPEQRTPERFAEAGGNVDRERFLSEVLVPLERGEAVNYRPFDCSTFTLKPPTEIIPQRLVVTEGAYSMHPELAKHYDISVFLKISPNEQKRRIEKRNGSELAKRFFNEWIPLEEQYFKAFNIETSCDIVI